MSVTAAILDDIGASVAEIHGIFSICKLLAAAVLDF